MDGIRCGSLAMIAVALTACGGDDSPQSPDAPGGSDSCVSAPDNCTGERICIGGICESVYGRFYDLSALAIQLPTTDPEGAAWDVGGGAPDIFAEILVNTQVTDRTPTADDTFSATFPGPFAIEVVGGSALTLQVYDEDLSVNDLAFSCQASPITPTQLRSRRIACATAGYQVSLRVDPR